MHGETTSTTSTIINGRRTSLRNQQCIKAQSDEAMVTSFILGPAAGANQAKTKSSQKPMKTTTTASKKVSNKMKKNPPSMKNKKGPKVKEVQKSNVLIATSEANDDNKNLSAFCPAKKSSSPPPFYMLMTMHFKANLSEKSCNNQQSSDAVKNLNGMECTYNNDDEHESDKENMASRTLGKRNSSIGVDHILSFESDETQEPCIANKFEY